LTTKSILIEGLCDVQRFHSIPQQMIFVGMLVMMDIALVILDMGTKMDFWDEHKQTIINSIFVALFCLHKKIIPVFILDELICSMDADVLRLPI
jgi:hypothetical protein